MNEVANPWVVQAPKQTAQVPVGFYTAKFLGVEEVQLQATEKDDGNRWRFAWEVQTGPEQGKQASALVDRGINPNAHAGRLISGLLGRAIVVGENVQASVDTCKGKVNLVTVQAGSKGGKPSVQSCGQPPAM